MYKSSIKMRKRALAYYYAHKEAVRKYQEGLRRARGVAPAKPKMTDAEKLARVRVCECGRRVTTRSLLLKCSNVCLRCLRQTPIGKATVARGNQIYRKSPQHLRAQVTAYKRKAGCQKCRRKDVPVTDLHFHHRDPKTKLFKIAWGVYHVASRALWAEIAKCDVMCEECHKAVHAGLR